MAVEPLDGDRWILSAAGARVEVVVVPAGARRAPDVVPRARRHGAGPVVAPMPGLVVRVRVTQGQRVDAGAGLVVVEAMKMENELRAPRGGVVTAVYVAPGATVEKGQPLVTIGDG